MTESPEALAMLTYPGFDQSFDIHLKGKENFYFRTINRGRSQLKSTSIGIEQLTNTPFLRPSGRSLIKGGRLR
jgi:hypothetical protein